MFIILPEKVPTVGNLRNNYPMYKSTVPSLSIQSNKQTMAIVNIYKERTFVKFQTVQRTNNSNSRSEDEEHKFVWRTATGGLRNQETEFLKIVCQILCADTHVCVSGEMIHSIHDNLKDPFD